MTYRDDMFITGEEAEVEGILREVQRSGRPKRPADGSDESQKRRRGRREGSKGSPIQVLLLREGEEVKEKNLGGKLVLGEEKVEHKTVCELLWYTPWCWK